MKRKSTACKLVCALALLVMLLMLPVTVLAQETTLTTQVPAHHFLKIDIRGNGTVTMDGTPYIQSTQVQIQRHSNPTISVQAASGYVIDSVSYNGEIITSQFIDGAWSMPDVLSDANLTVAFVMGTDNPATGDWANIHLWYVAAIVALTGIILCLLKINKDKLYYNQQR